MVFFFLLGTWKDPHKVVVLCLDDFLLFGQALTYLIELLLDFWCVDWTDM